MDINDQPWRCLTGKFAPEVLRAPQTIFDPASPLPSSETIRAITRLLLGLQCSPWLDALGLSVGVCITREVSLREAVAIVQSVDKGFWATFRGVYHTDDWNASEAVCIYLDSGGFGNSWSCRSEFVGNYHQLAHQLCHWHQRLLPNLQQSYQFLASFTPLHSTKNVGELT